MTSLEPVATKLGKLLRMLSSEHDGEVVAAARAIRRTLESERLDIHTLARAVESPTETFSEDDAKKIYRRAFQAGRDAAEAERGFRSIDEFDQPTWHEIAHECASHPEKLRAREHEFVDDMIRRTIHGGELTEKQEKWLRDIYVRIRK
jgi:hypothetical protein